MTNTFLDEVKLRKPVAYPKREAKESCLTRKKIIKEGISEHHREKRQQAKTWINKIRLSFSCRIF
jgi:hypothetical protein